MGKDKDPKRYNFEPNFENGKYKEKIMKSYLKNKKDDTYYENLQDWNSAYIPFLTNFFIHGNWERKNEPYEDPDSTAEEFYKALRIFLQAQEDSYRDLLNGHFKYEFDFPYIKVEKETNEEGIYEQLFYLKSDQFGFSRPSDKKSHPYDTYIEMCSNKENAIENVARWIYESRTIGGAFLWPLEVDEKGELYNRNNPPYNMRRGGSCKGGSKIEDRVDLTLFEIKMLLDGKHNNKVILERVSRDGTNMKKWLDHFKSFETYISFFCFDDFLSEKDIINIVGSNINTEKPDQNHIELLKENDIGERKIYEICCRRGYPNIGTPLLDNEKLKTMLNNVNILIKRRTEKMEEIIMLASGEIDHSESGEINQF